MNKPKKEEIEKIKKFIGIEEEKATVNIIYDKKQWSIRIPKKFIESSQINKKDKFEFTLMLPSTIDKGELPKLKGRLIRE